MSGAGMGMLLLPTAPASFPLRLAPPVDFLVVYGKHNLAIIKTLL